MLINLPLLVVDNNVDLMLNKNKDVNFTRRVYASPRKIIYSIKISKLNTKFRISIYSVTENITEVDFPVYIPPSTVVQFRNGRIVEVYDGQYVEPVIENPGDKKAYEICRSIGRRIKLTERKLGMDKDVEPSGTKKPKRTIRGPQSSTEESLRKLREIKSNALRDHRAIPTRQAAMHEAEITDKTWKKHDPDLYAQWDIREIGKEKSE